MFAEERRHKILDILNSDKQVSVKELSELFNVSEVIIRKDLKKLEENNLLERTHGGAIPIRRHVAVTNINKRLIDKGEHKLRIARSAYDQIKEGDSVFLDSSSINLLLADLLNKDTKKITVITNMLEIAHILAGNRSVTLICTGGYYSSKTGAFSGSLTVENISKFNPDKLFLGVAGINTERGFLSNFDIEEGKTKNAMLESAGKIFLIAENKKFYQDALYNFSPLTNVDAIITDKEPEPALMEKLKNSSIDIII